MSATNATSPSAPPATPVGSSSGSSPKTSGSTPNYAAIAKANVPQNPSKEAKEGKGEAWLSSPEAKAKRAADEAASRRDKLNKFHPNLEMSGKGFDGKLGEARQKYVVDVLQSGPLTYKGIHKLLYEPLDEDRPSMFGSWDRDNRAMRLYTSIDVFSPRTRVDVLVHEQAHQASCFWSVTPWKEAKNGINPRETAQKLIQQVAKQSVESGVSLDSYHDYLCYMYEQGKISFQRLCGETEAILVQMRITNPNQLRQVEAIQKTGSNPQNLVSLWEASTAILTGMDNGLPYMDEQALETSLSTMRTKLTNIQREYGIALRTYGEEPAISQLREKYMNLKRDNTFGAEGAIDGEELEYEKKLREDEDKKDEEKWQEAVVDTREVDENTGNEVIVSRQVLQKIVDGKVVEQHDVKILNVKPLSMTKPPQLATPTAAPRDELPTAD